MAALNDINVSVQLGTPTVSRQGFQRAMVVGRPTFSERYRIYESADAAQNDGDLTADLVEHVEAAFNQGSNSPQEVLVGRRQTDQDKIFEITIDAVENETYEYDITIDGSTHTATEDNSGGSNSSTGGIATDLESAISTVISNNNLDLTSSVSGSTVTIQSGTPGHDFDVAKGSGHTASDSATTETTTQAVINIETELQEIENALSDWFGLTLASHDTTQPVSDTDLAADWAEGRTKLFVPQFSDSVAKNTSEGNGNGVADRLFSAGYENTVPVWYSDDGDEVAFGWMAAKLSADPDVQSTTWKFYTVNGFDDDDLTSTEQANLESKNVNFYGREKGVKSMAQGVTSAGRFIDTRISAEWVRARLESDFTDILSSASNNNEKVSYTDGGIQRLTQAVEERYDQGVDADHFVAGTLDVDVPQLQDIPDSDRQNRELNTLQWGMQPAGAIHDVDTTGYINVSFDGF